MWVNVQVTVNVKCLSVQYGLLFAFDVHHQSSIIFNHQPSTHHDIFVIFCATAASE